MQGKDERAVKSKVNIILLAYSEPNTAWMWRERGEREASLMVSRALEFRSGMPPWDIYPLA